MFITIRFLDLLSKVPSVMAIEINKNIHILLAENREVRGELGASLRMHGYKNVDEISDYKDVSSAVSQREIDLLVTD